MLEEIYFFKDIPDFIVGFLFEGIDILADRSLKQEWLLWYKRNILSQNVQSEVLDILAINYDLSI